MSGDHGTITGMTITGMAATITRVMSHAPASFGRAFAIGIALNLAFIVAEVVYGVLGNSTALLADAGHNLSDALGLGLAWLASEMVKRPPTPRFSYGLLGSSILAALFNAVFLLVAVGAISWEAILRLFAPEPVAGKTIMIVAALGVVINGVTAWLFASGKDDINLRAAFLHMASDAFVSAGVVVAGLADPADAMVLARPRGQSGDQRRHPVGNLGPAARGLRHVDVGGARSYRPGSGARFPGRASASRRCTIFTSGR